MNLRNIFAVYLLTLLLNGCGSSDDTSAPELMEQSPILFESASIQMMIDESQPDNPFTGGSGTGALEWSVSNTSVADIDSSAGAITPKDNGIVSIVITKLGDDVYKTATASYELIIDKYVRDSLYFLPGAFSPTSAEYEDGLSLLPMRVRAKGIPPAMTTHAELSFNLPTGGSGLDPNDFDSADLNTFNASFGFSAHDSEGNSQLYANYFIKDPIAGSNSWIMVSSLDGVFYDYANLDGTAPIVATTPNTSHSTLVGYGQMLNIRNIANSTAGVRGIRLTFDETGDLISLESPDGLDYAVEDNDIQMPIFLFTETTPNGEEMERQIAINLHYDPNTSPEHEPTSTDATYEVSLIEQNGREADEPAEELISYTSSDENVAVFDSASYISLVGPGQTTITATVAEDGLFLEGSIGYVLTVY